MNGSISAIPQNRLLGGVADFLKYLETEKPEFLPKQLDVMGLMRQLALPSASTVENMSYGNSPFTMAPSGTGSLIPQVKTGRKAEVADLIGMISGVPGGKAVIDSGTKISQDALNAYLKMIRETPPVGAINPEQAGKVLTNTKIVDDFGNPQRMYHGTPEVVDRLEPQKRGMISLTPDPDFAFRYAGQDYTTEVLGGNPNIWPVYADVKNPFDYDNPSHVKMVMDEVKLPPSVNKENVLENISLGSWNFIEDKNVQEAIKKLGFDGFYMKEMGVKNLGVYSPDQVKSAISDPAFLNDYSSLKTIADDLDQKIRSGDFSIKDVNERERLLKKMQELEAQTTPQIQPIMQDQPTGLLDTSYRGMHTAPGKDFGAQLFELDKIYPDDIYSANAARFYGHGGDQVKIDQKSAQIIRSFRGQPDAEVTIYRAVPKDESIKEINPGDWVTINKGYAKEHGESVLGGDYKIIEKKVTAKDIWTDANSIHEYGYDPF